MTSQFCYCGAPVFLCSRGTCICLNLAFMASFGKTFCAKKRSKMACFIRIFMDLLSVKYVKCPALQDFAMDFTGRSWSENLRICGSQPSSNGPLLGAMIRFCRSPGTRRGHEITKSPRIPRHWMFLVLKNQKLCHFDIHFHIFYISMVYVAANVHMDPWSTAAWGLPRPRRSQWAPINSQLATGNLVPSPVWLVVNFSPELLLAWKPACCRTKGENIDAAQASGSHSRKNFGNKPVYLIRNRLPSFLSPHQPIINSLCHLLEE